MTDTPQTTDTPAAEPAAAPEVKATEAAAPAAEPVKEPAAEPAKDPAPAADKKPADKAPAKEPAKADAKPTNTVLDAEPDPAPEPADWPSDWREKLAGEDKKLLSTLKRFASPKTFSDSYFAMKHKLSSGEYLKALPENASEEDLAEYRKTLGIPETPEGYDLTALPEGLSITEADKPAVADYLKQAHALNLTEAQVKQNVAWYLQNREAEQAALQQRNEQRKDETMNALRAEWGNEFRPNLNAMNGYLDTLGADAKQALLSARDADGTMLLNNPAVVKALAQTARDLNPAATVVSATGANAAGAIADEIASISKMMGDYNSDYWRGPKVEGTGETKLQKRYAELLEAQERMRSRAA